MARLSNQPSATKRLLSSHRVLEDVRILEGRKLDGISVVEVAHDSSGRLADTHHRSDRWPVLADHRNARYREVDDAAFLLAAGFQPHRRGLVRGRDARVAAVLLQIQTAAVGEPSQLSGELVTFAWGRRDRHRESARIGAGDPAFEAPDMVDIGDDPFTGFPHCG